MVLIVKPAAGPGGRDRAERRLAAAMLNVEHAALAYDDDGAPRPPPHAPWPVVAVPPLTARGLAVGVHYRAAVGVVFYTEGAGFGGVGGLARRAGALLEAAGDAHLRAHRAVGATPAAVLRRRGAVAGGTRVVGPRPCYRKVEQRDGGEALPARVLMWPARGEYKLPPHYSLRAAFTWVFLEVPAVFAVTRFDGMAEVNAMVASVLYDDALLARPADGAEVYRLGPGDFTPPPPPAGLAGGDDSVPGLDADAGRRGEGGLVVDPAGALAYVGRPRSLGGAGAAWPPDWRRAAGAAGVREAPWDPAGLLLRAPGAFQCCACDAPIGGPALVLRGARAPARAEHREWSHCPLPRGAPLLGAGAPADAGLLLCPACFAALEGPACLAAHLGARLEATVVPLSQAAACRGCPGYERLAGLLEGRAEPVRGAPGAFVVRPPAAGGPGPFVLAGRRLGAHPAFTVPGLAALGLPVIPGVRLVEVRRPGRGV